MKVKSKQWHISAWLCDDFGNDDADSGYDNDDQDGNNDDDDDAKWIIRHNEYLLKSVRGAPPPPLPQKKRDFFGGFFPKGGEGGGLLNSQNFCKFTKLFLVCQDHVKTINAPKIQNEPYFFLELGVPKRWGGGAPNYRL